MRPDLLPGPTKVMSNDPLLHESLSYIQDDQTPRKSPWTLANPATGILSLQAVILTAPRISCGDLWGITRSGLLKSRIRTEALPLHVSLLQFLRLVHSQHMAHSHDLAERTSMTATRKTSANAGVAPRVFLSYARSDGEQFAAQLRHRLQAEHIALWQDRIGMEGGRDWWLQITQALDVVEFMVLVMTPAAMQSEMVRKEWRYARQQGVCVYPVKGASDLDFHSLPHWMRSAHFYDLAYEWPKLLNDLNTRCQQPRVPFMVEDLPADYVPRPREFEALIEKLLDQRREEPVAITAALRGAGGYGKTTMARALCHDERIQQAFDDGILWVTLGEHPGNLMGKVEDLHPAGGR